jgi:hypothetical protein
LKTTAGSFLMVIFKKVCCACRRDNILKSHRKWTSAYSAGRVTLPLHTAARRGCSRRSSPPYCAWWHPLQSSRS